MPILGENGLLLRNKDYNQPFLFINHEKSFISPLIKGFDSLWIALKTKHNFGEACPFQLAMRLAI